MITIQNNINVYTDLALEARDLAIERTGGEVEGVTLTENQSQNARITRIEIFNQQGAEALGKPIGTYITIESDELKGQNRLIHDELSEVLARELESLLNFNQYLNRGKDPLTFVVGLGNWNATPDALGPHVMNNLMVTRHLYQQAPPELREGMRSVCALAPGVLGLTGIQTAEIIKGVVEMVKPDLIIAIDSLAARSTSRLGTTVQLSNTGIFPGSGIGKNRAGINQQTMQIPVIAIGVPTVVGAATIISDAVDSLINSNIFSGVEKQRFRQVSQQAKNGTIKNVLSTDLGGLIVSPQGIDELVEDVSRIIAGGINVAIHPDITPDNLSLYL